MTGEWKGEIGKKAGRGKREEGRETERER